MFSLLWSEHCAYKHSRKLLRRLPTEGERVVMGPGENAGAVDIGNGYAIAFKVESHNHPSAVEPFQGAATGVGGILRDVFALGARPIAILDSLRFGELDSERSRFLLDGAVRGIGHYGNSIGVADGRRRDLLRGALRAQLPGQRDVRRDRQAGRDGPRRRRRGRQRGRPDGRLDRPRRDRRRLGAGLGRARRGRRREAADGADRRPLRGVEGARVLPGAAREGAARLAAGPRRRRPHLLGGRDGLGRRGRDRHRRRPGAAARGRHGALRDHGLRVPGADARRGRAGAGSPRCWRSARSGRPARPRSASITDSGQVRVLRGRRGRRRDAGRGAGRRLPALRPQPGRAGGLDLRQPGDARRRAPRPRRRCWPCSPPPASPPSAGPSSSTTRWSARAPCGGPSPPTPPSSQIPEAGNAIAVSIDGNGRRVACDPYAGTVEAVLECAQNLACVGAEPLGLTNCLNFGNPEKPAPGLAARPRGQRPRRRLRGARRPGRRRQRLPLQRGAGRADLPDPGGRHGRRAARPGARRRLRLRRRGRRDRPARPLRPDARRLGAGEAARRARHRAARARHRRGRRRLRGGPLRGPRGPARLRPRRQRRRPRLRPRRVGDRRRASAAGSTCSRCASAAARPRRRSSARARAASWSAASARRWRRSARP